MHLRCDLKKQIKNIKKLFPAILLCALSISAFSQTATTGQIENKPALQASAVQEHVLNSKLMARPMPYRVITPKNYESDKAAKFPVLYLLHGLTGRYSDWVDRAKLKEYAANYNYLIVTVEGGNGWYTDSASQPNEKYESYIVQELVPEVETKFRALIDRRHRAIAGLSMGGYGSLKFGLKYPEKFVLVGSFSGALGAASWSDKTLGNNWKALTDSIMSVYGADGSETRAANDIFKMTREMTPEKIKALPFMYIDCGTEDFVAQQSRDFVALLAEKKIPHEYRQLPGGHNWQYWDLQIQEFLRVSQKFIK